MSTSPLLERLREHARREQSIAAQRHSRQARTEAQRGQVAFWHSPVARAAINRRVTGDPEMAPETYFARRYGPSVPAPLALSLRASDARLEIALLESGPCERLIGLHEDPGPVEFANGRVPEPLRAQIHFKQGDLAQWDAPESLGAVIARSVLHRQSELDHALDRIESMLTDGGLLFVDEYVGPARAQWSDVQLDAINRLLARLPEELRVELTSDDGQLKRSVGRPDADSAAAANQNEMVCSDRIVAGLDERFERVEVSLYGGAIFHQLFSRIMGNFASRPELVAVLMELDALLTDALVVSSDYVWGVWRRA
jgi:SAM-dependent methyltransferase